MEEKKVNSTLIIEDAKLIFKNFSGKKTDYNLEGNRNFCILLDDELAEQLESDGWNIKRRKPMADDPEQYRAPYMPVKVQFGKYSPTIVLITSRGKKRLDEDTVNMLDWSRIIYADIQIRPYNYEARGNRPAGVSAYLKQLYVRIQEDPLETKYADIPDLDIPGQIEMPFDDGM